MPAIPDSATLSSANNVPSPQFWLLPIFGRSVVGKCANYFSKVTVVTVDRTLAVTRTAAAAFLLAGWTGYTDLNITFSWKRGMNGYTWNTSHSNNGTFFSKDVMSRHPWGLEHVLAHKIQRKWFLGFFPFLVPSTICIVWCTAYRLRRLVIFSPLNVITFL